MRVVFCGTQPGIGTSANMQAVISGLRVMCGVRVSRVCDVRQFIKMESEDLLFFDASRIRGETMDRLLGSSDIIVVNISQADSGLKQFYLDYRLVHSNLIFLVGKYHKDTEHELKILERQYRIETGRICAMSYNIRFQKAYEEDKVLPFLRKELLFASSWENQQFLLELQDMLHAFLQYSAFERSENYG